MASLDSKPWPWAKGKAPSLWSQATLITSETPDYTVVGLGYALGPESDYYHYWTQCFGGGH